MAESDEFRPWRLRFAWKDGASGLLSFSTEELADGRADHIRNTAQEMGREVTVSVKYEVSATYEGR